MLGKCGTQEEAALYASLSLFTLCSLPLVALPLFTRFQHEDAFKAQSSANRHILHLTCEISKDMNVKINTNTGVIPVGSHSAVLKESCNRKI
jgi:hypothetical protein